MTPTETLLGRLAGVRRSGSGWSARCPAHDDRKPSLSISEGDDGRVLIKCFAGCSVEAIVSAVGLGLQDLFPEGASTKPHRDGKPAAGKAAASESSSVGETFVTAQAALAELERHYGERTGLWFYQTVDARLVGAVVRWDTPGGKIIRPISRRGKHWVIGAMPSRGRCMACPSCCGPIRHRP